MKLINKNLFFLLLVGLTTMAIRPSHVERPIDETVARKELKEATEESKSKLEAIRTKEQEIEERQKQNDKEGEERATKELVELNKEASELFEQKIKAADNVLNFKPNDAMAKVARETAQATQKAIEAELKRVERKLAEAGVGITAPFEVDLQLSLGTRIAKNFKVWRDTVRARVHESLGNYETARKLRDSLATLYAELRKPIRHVENLLAADRLSLKLGEEPRKISNLIDIFTNHLQRLERINAQEKRDLDKAATAEEKAKIRSQAKEMRDRALDPRVLDDILETTVKIREKLTDPLLGTVKEKLETLENQLETIFSQLDASKESFRPRTHEERVADAQNQERNIIGSLTQVKNIEPKSMGILTDPFQAEKSKDYKDLMANLEKLEKIDFDVLSPERKLEIGYILKSTYEKLSNQFGSLIKDSQASKKFTPEQQSSLVEKWVDFSRKTAQWTESIENTIKEEKTLEDKNSPEYKKYSSVLEANSKANTIDASHLNAAELKISKLKQEIDELLQKVTTVQDMPEKIDVAATNFDRSVEDIIHEIAKSDPAQRSLETLKRIIDSSQDSIQEFKSILETTNLSSEVQTALIKNYLKTIIRTDQVLAQRAEGLGALTIIVGDTLALLPQIEENNIVKAHEIPTAPPPPPLVVQAAKDIWQAGKNMPRTTVQPLINEISNVQLKTPTTESPRQKTGGNELVDSLKAAFNKKFKEVQESEVTEEEGEVWEF